jgi:hypothetical protein
VIVPHLSTKAGETLNVKDLDNVYETGIGHLLATGMEIVLELLIHRLLINEPGKEMVNKKLRI